MAHIFTFDNMDRFILTKGEIIDLVEMFYRWDDATFEFREGKCAKSTFLGQHSFNGDMHFITFSQPNIERAFRNKSRVGGNATVAPTLKAAAAMVLAHELQHANQEKLHGSEKGFYGIKKGHTQSGRPRMQRYWKRSCEREARAFVDERADEIYAYFDVPTARQKAPALQGDGNSIGARAGVSAVAALFKDCQEVRFGDVREELRLEGALNPANMQAVVDELRKSGCRVVIS